MNMLKMIGKIKEVLTWVWIAVIGTAIRGTERSV